MKNLKKIAFGLGMAAVFIALFAGNEETKAANLNKALISEGVNIGAVNVGGMSKAEAAEAVNEYVNGLNKATFVLKET